METITNKGGTIMEEKTTMSTTQAESGQNLQSPETKKEKSAAGKLVTVIIVLAILGGIGFGIFKGVTLIQKNLAIADMKGNELPAYNNVAIGDIYKVFLEDPKWECIKENGVQKIKVSGVHKEDGAEYKLEAKLTAEGSDDDLKLSQEYKVDGKELSSDYDNVNLKTTILRMRYRTADELSVSKDEIIKAATEIKLDGFDESGLKDIKSGSFVCTDYYADSVYTGVHVIDESWKYAAGYCLDYNTEEVANYDTIVTLADRQGKNDHVDFEEQGFYKIYGRYIGELSDSESVVIDVYYAEKVEY